MTIKRAAEILNLLVEEGCGDLPFFCYADNKELSSEQVIQIDSLITTTSNGGD